MIVCTKCGFENEDSDTFCGSCAGFLEWSGERVKEEVPEPEPEPEVAEELHPGFIERVKDRIGIGESHADEADGGAAPNGAGGAPVVTAPAGETSSVPAAASVAPAAAGTVAAAATAAPAATSSVTSTPAPSSTVTAGAPSGPVASTVAPPAPAPTAPAAPTATVTKTEPVAPTAVQPAAVQPQAVKPQAVKARPQAKKAPSTRTINPGDLVCGQCGEGNDPVRKFCRRCGASLQEAVVFNLPWYRKLWRILTRKRTRVAGDRPKLRRRLIGGSGPGLLWGILRLVIVVAIIVVVILAFVGPWKGSIKHRASRYYHDVVGVVHPHYTPVHPPESGVTATSDLLGFPASAVVDEATNTHWASAPAHDGVGATLTVRMPSATRLDKIGFLDGNQDGQSTFLTDPVPQGIRVVFNQDVQVKNAQGHTVTKVEPLIKNWTLKDVPSFQTFTISAKNVVSVEVTILSVYPASTANGHNASIAEIEFFKKS